MGEAPRRGQGGVAVFRRDVEHAGAGTEIERLAERLPHDLEGGADDGVVPELWRGRSKCSICVSRDPVVGAALALIRERPAHDWSLVSLARQVAASRSVLAERFTHLVGLPVMQYLALWRLQLAADLLARGNESVATVARRVGYDSEAAFSRAFKRVMG